MSTFRRRLRATAARPTTPMPNRASVPGSGTTFTVASAIVDTEPKLLDMTPASPNPKLMLRAVGVFWNEIPAAPTPCLIVVVPTVFPVNVTVDNRQVCCPLTLKKPWLAVVKKPKLLPPTFTALASLIRKLFGESGLIEPHRGEPPEVGLSTV